jgi:uncharacterized zinc-type alcohol dehydrogenase-like protein
VCFDIKFCGICHTDVTFIKNELGNNPTYPLTPGMAFPVQLNLNMYI